ncbi:MAG: hypothetical protein J0L97_00405 [Alphaproteobacteria bacterium]|nr:hypothetical protein [Alphaproteobacteria bacterium]
MKRNFLANLLLAITCLTSGASMATPVPAEEESAFTKALTGGKLLFDTRYRYELVDQDGLTRDANAHTLRTRLGYETGKFHDFAMLLEFEGIAGLGAERYNDTINGKTSYPIVADPEDAALNRLQLSYTGLPDTNVTLGRQVINLDNQRFVGSVGWRQNDQTLDALSVKNQSLKDTTLFYAYANQVNRVFGTDSPAGIWNDAHIHLLNASYAGLPFGKITGYSYLLDVADSKALSSATFGARFEGKHAIGSGVTGLLGLEYAHQSDYADNPNNLDFNYFSIEPGIAFGQWTVKVQYESIEGDGANAMQFALGTNHAFDGWVDKFLTTPGNGLVDTNIAVSYAFKSENPYLNGIKATVAYHDFSAERGGANYGTEWDAVVEQTFEKYYTLGLKFGRYDADRLYTDTVKIMPYAQIKF